MKVPPASVLWLGWIIWLPFFVQPALDLVGSPASAALKVACFCLLAAFAALYAASAWLNARDLSTLPTLDYRERSRLRLPNIIGLVVLSIAMALLWHAGGAYNMSSFIYTSAYVGGSLRPRRAVETNAVLFVVYAAIGRLSGQAWSDAGFLLFLVTVVTFVTISWVSAVIAGHELLAAQGEISRLAAEAERHRITRDLHDLLGHQLSLITLKSELAGRLAETDPRGAAAEIRQIEQLVRSTLQEVRAAVSRYRTPTVALELRAGREILTAAGIRPEGDWDERALGRLPPGHEEAIAWVVRECVTNVIRHSDAGACRLSMSTRH